MTDLQQRIADLNSHMDASRARLATECITLRAVLEAIQKEATERNASQADCDSIDALEEKLFDLDPETRDG